MPGKILKFGSLAAVLGLVVVASWAMVDTGIHLTGAAEGTLLPFLVEDQLRKNGAIAENKETLADKHEVVVDRRIVSTMFLPSAANVAVQMMRLLK